MSSAGNLSSRVKRAILTTTGIIPGADLFAIFKSEIQNEPVMRTLFGESCERVFHDKKPNLNETILPCLLLAWKNETFTSNDTYLEGSIEAAICLPVMLTGNFNELRQVGQIFQRFMGGRVSMFDKVPGLVRFGVGMAFDYTNLAEFDGLTCPVITIQIPFRFDLQLLRIQRPEFDPSAPLDAEDLGWAESFRARFFNAENNDTLIDEGVLLETGN
jgi:hypothetical protein